MPPLAGGCEPLTHAREFYIVFLIFYSVLFIYKEVYSVRALVPSVIIKEIRIDYLAYFICRYFVVMVYDLIEMCFPV